MTTELKTHLLSTKGLRLATRDESGWVVRLDAHTTVWATDEGPIPAPLSSDQVEDLEADE